MVVMNTMGPSNPYKITKLNKSKSIGHTSMKSSIDSMSSYVFLTVLEHIFYTSKKLGTQLQKGVVFFA